jgi:hypothetical protein
MERIADKYMEIVKMVLEFNKVKPRLVPLEFVEMEKRSL